MSSSSCSGKRSRRGDSGSVFAWPADDICWWFIVTQGLGDDSCAGSNKSEAGGGENAGNSGIGVSNLWVHEGVRGESSRNISASFGNGTRNLDVGWSSSGESETTVSAGLGTVANSMASVTAHGFGDSVFGDMVSAGLDNDVYELRVHGSGGGGSGNGIFNGNDGSNLVKCGSVGGELCGDSSADLGNGVCIFGANGSCGDGSGDGISERSGNGV